MTVDQFPLPSAAISPLPPPWPADAKDCDHLGAEPAAVHRPGQDEPPIEPSGWPRIFPGL